MADEGYWICFVTDTLSPEIGTEIVARAERVGLEVVERTDEEITLRLDEVTTVSVTLNLGESWDWNDPRLILSFWTKPLQRSGTEQGTPDSSESVRDRTETILGLVIELVKLTEPEYVWSMLNAGPQPDAGLRPTSRPIADNISRLSWVTVFSEQIVANLGGRDRVLETPAWRVEPIDDSHLIVITTDNPVDPAVEPESDPVDFLFEDSGTNSPDQS